MDYTLVKPSHQPHLCTAGLAKTIHTRYTTICMKRKLGTVVLFVLLIVTVFALVNLDQAEARDASAQTMGGSRDGIN